MHMIEDKEVQDRIIQLVKAGFMEAHEIANEVHEYFDGECSDIYNIHSYALTFAQGAIRQQLIQQRTWRETDCDKLDEAFAELDRIGIVARQNFACCQSCGHEHIKLEMQNTLEHRPVSGYVFFHQQDTEHVVTFNRLYLAYGAASGKEDDCLSVATQVTATLRQHGLTVDWNGMIQKRICIPNINWQRRRLNDIK